VNNKYLIQIYKPSDTGSSLHLKIILEKYTVEIKDLKTFTVNGVRINATNEGYSPENDADFFKYSLIIYLHEMSIMIFACSNVQ